MQINEEVIERLAQIDDSLIMRGEESQLLEKGYGAIGDIEWEGIALRTPDKADISRHEGFPIIIASKQTADRGKDVVYGDNAVVICNQTDGDGLWITPVFPEDPRKVPMDSDDSEPDSDESDDDAEPVAVTSVERLDLKQHGLPWERGSYASRVICYDWLSNTVVFELIDPQTTDSVAEAQLTEERKKRNKILADWGRRDRGKPDKFPNFVGTTHSPEVSGIGVDLSLPMASFKVGKPIPVYGTARLEAKSDWRPSITEPVAVVPGFIVLARRGILNPIIVNLDVPLYSQADISLGTPIDGYFAYNLNELVDSPLPIALYQVYLIIGEYISGPIELNIRGE